MEIHLPEKVNIIITRLMTAGYEAYAVGGCVRDSILGRVPQDWDITTSAKPEEVKAVFDRTIDTGIQHGTVTVMLDREGFEVTTYRLDGEYEDARHPKEVTFTRSLEEDLKRRDFTINAMAYNKEQGLVDIFDGRGDLERGTIRCVGEPLERFGEDALRMLRAIRFGAQLGFEIEEKTYEAIKQLAPTMEKISAERIQTELVKLLVSNHPERIRQIYETGLSKIFLPEFDAMMVCPQNTKHHCYSVGEHTIKAMTLIGVDKVKRLTMLLHDVAKPVCRTTDQAGVDHFKGHPVIGADMAKKILRRLKFDNDTIQKVITLIRWHDDKPALRKARIRLAVYRVGKDSYPALFEVKRADMLAQSEYKRAEKEEYLETYRRLYREIIESGDALSIKELKIDGKRLLELGVPQGPQVGIVLEKLLFEVLGNPDLNTTEKLEQRVRFLRNCE